MKMEQSVTINNDICRCCATQGTYKNIRTSYQWMGEEEVYADMLRECFSISLCLSDSCLEEGICEVCISQLRNSANFKKQVLQTEEQFRKKIDGVITEVKLEDESQPEEKLIDSDTELHEAFGDDYIDDDYPLSAIKDEIKPKLETKAKKRAAKTVKTKAKKAKTEEGETSTKRTDGAEGAKPGRKKTKKSAHSATPERLEHRVNLTAILQHSNATPFRDKKQKGFACLYCAKYFKTLDELRMHTAQQTEKNKLNTMIDYKLSYNPIKVDITNLVCTLCDIPMSDLSALKDHLISAHNKRIYKNIKDIILPFRLEDGNDFKCVVCSVVHISFKNLYHHMSSHYNNYMCNICGVGYITIAAMRKHKKTHEEGQYPCTYCGKKYNSIVKKNYHEKGVHQNGWLRNKCPHCPKVFVSYYDRSEHLVKVHNEAPVNYPCNACTKVYKKKFELNRHIRHHHLQQKSFMCDKCNAKFFSRRGLLDHLVRHEPGFDQKFSCDICGKVFTMSKSLRDHLKLHTGGKKYECEVCKKTFMQKYSLKSHVRLHQDDLDIFKEFDDVKHLIDNRDMTLKEIAEEEKRKAEAEKSGTFQEFIVVVKPQELENNMHSLDFHGGMDISKAEP